MDAAFPDDLEGLAVQGEGQGDGVRAIRDIHDIIDDGHAVRIGDGADAPGVEVVTVAIKDHHRRVLALEDVEAVLGIGRHRADQPKCCPAGSLGKSWMSS